MKRQKTQNSKHGIDGEQSQQTGTIQFKELL